MQKHYLRNNFAFSCRFFKIRNKQNINELHFSRGDLPISLLAWKVTMLSVFVVGSDLKIVNQLICMVHSILDVKKKQVINFLIGSKKVRASFIL